MRIVHDCKKQEFILITDDNITIGKITYTIGRPNEIYVPHTKVNPAYEGHGYAMMLLDALVGYAKAENIKIVPICPYVVSAFKKFPDKYAAIMKETA